MPSWLTFGSWFFDFLYFLVPGRLLVKVVSVDPYFADHPDNSEDNSLAAVIHADQTEEVRAGACL